MTGKQIQHGRVAGIGGEVGRLQGTQRSPEPRFVFLFFSSFFVVKLQTTEWSRARGRPPTELKRLKLSSLEVLQKSATLRACLHVSVEMTRNPPTRSVRTSKRACLLE